ncbi:DUF447 domain-containing protein [Methanobrevibacter sp.]|uniref:DUF447 domain-containing protein n=1 Tax=Methanobrevibacter sp. TaxID=66852 RepID=UPI0025DB303D|nr:DUF447 domain-containing protein [Methanobrevibacter sp.]MBQ2961865.1 DUF447 family protein [Methanobrevibacter sp.]
MKIDLSEIGMNKGQQYETIITTIDENGKSNAAPFGLRVLDKDKVQLRIFEGGNSIKNIKANKEFVINLTENPLMFTLSSVGTIPEEYLSRIDSETKNNKELPYLTNADAYFICEVETLKTAFRENDPIKDTEVNMIKANVVELTINNKCARPLNRAIHALIEALVNYSRIDFVNSETQKIFLERFLESERIIKRVGNEEEKESIKILKEKLIEKGYEI